MVLDTSAIIAILLKEDERDRFIDAMAAWRRYGKGNHPARLNFCDCCAYALSRLSGEALLFKGNDFGQTDVMAVVPVEG